MVCGVADCRDSGIEDCSPGPHTPLDGLKQRQRDGLEQTGQAQAKAVSATGADGSRI